MEAPDVLIYTAWLGQSYWEFVGSRRWRRAPFGASRRTRSSGVRMRKPASSAGDNPNPPHQRGIPILASLAGTYSALRRKKRLVSVRPG